MRPAARPEPAGADARLLPSSIWAGARPAGWLLAGLQPWGSTPSKPVWLHLRHVSADWGSGWHLASRRWQRQLGGAAAGLVQVLQQLGRGAPSVRRRHPAQLGCSSCTVPLELPADGEVLWCGCAPHAGVLRRRARPWQGVPRPPRVPLLHAALSGGCACRQQLTSAGLAGRQTQWTWCAPGRASPALRASTSSSRTRASKVLPDCCACLAWPLTRSRTRPPCWPGAAHGPGARLCAQLRPLLPALAHTPEPDEPTLVCGCSSAQHACAAPSLVGHGGYCAKQHTSGSCPPGTAGASPSWAAPLRAHAGCAAGRLHRCVLGGPGNIRRQRDLSAQQQHRRWLLCARAPLLPLCRLACAANAADAGMHTRTSLRPAFLRPCTPCLRAVLPARTSPTTPGLRAACCARHPPRGVGDLADQPQLHRPVQHGPQQHHPCGVAPRGRLWSEAEPPRPGLQLGADRQAAWQAHGALAAHRQGHCERLVAAAAGCYMGAGLPPPGQRPALLPRGAGVPCFCSEASHVCPALLHAQNGP